MSLQERYDTFFHADYDMFVFYQERIGLLTDFAHKQKACSRALTTVQGNSVYTDSSKK